MENIDRRAEPGKVRAVCSVVDRMGHVRNEWPGGNFDSVGDARIALGLGNSRSQSTDPIGEDVVTFFNDLGKPVGICDAEGYRACTA